MNVNHVIMVFYHKIRNYVNQQILFKIVCLLIYLLIVINVMKIIILIKIYI